MNKLLGENEQFLRFLLLVCAMLMLAGAIACFVWSKALLAVACSIIGAWSIGVYLDSVWLQLAARQRGASEDEQEESGS